MQVAKCERCFMFTQFCCDVKLPSLFPLFSLYLINVFCNLVNGVPSSQPWETLFSKADIRWIGITNNKIIIKVP